MEKPTDEVRRTICRALESLRPINPYRHEYDHVRSRPGSSWLTIGRDLRLSMKASDAAAKIKVDAEVDEALAWLGITQTKEDADRREAFITEAEEHARLAVNLRARNETVSVEKGRE